MSPSPCAFCDFPDSRHRLVDSMEERIAAGESLESMLADYGMTEVEFLTLRRVVYPAECPDDV